MGTHAHRLKARGTRLCIRPDDSRAIGAMIRASATLSVLAPGPQTRNLRCGTIPEATSLSMRHDVAPRVTARARSGTGASASIAATTSSQDRSVFESPDAGARRIKGGEIRT